MFRFPPRKLSVSPVHLLNGRNFDFVLSFSVVQDIRKYTALQQTQNICIAFVQWADVVQMLYTCSVFAGATFYLTLLKFTDLSAYYK